ncbi:MAG: hypothetical protein OXP71_09615 [Candidatus Poribacteria bacterium]|nr:hypothetical protein [Candidatus Poribacteria bacterium]
MTRFIVMLAVSVGCCFHSGCVLLGSTSMQGGYMSLQGMSPALESTVIPPVFCVRKHEAAKDEFDHIRRLQVYLDTGYSELPPGRSEDVIDWFIEYQPDSSAHTASPVTAIEYGTVPPGYKEKHPALPLIPEKVYIAYAWGLSYDYPTGGTRFVIRADESGKPVKLEPVFSRYFVDD